MSIETITQAEKSMVAKEEASFFARHGQKLVAAAFWLILIGGYAYYYISNGLTTEKAILQIVDLLESPLGPVLYIVVYALRPLIFFSAVALTVTAGAVFGAGSFGNLVYAVILTFVASLTSATVAYYVGRFFGQGIIKEEGGEKKGVVRKYADRLRNNSFETVLIMRFIFLPYDLVNYLAGILKIDWKAFILATWLGSIPGTVAFVSFGASIDIRELAMGNLPEFDPWVFVFGIAIFIVSLAISRYYKKREAQREQTEAG